MKKLILLTAVSIMSVSAAFSQVSFGVKGGLNLATMTNFEGDTGMKPSFYVGGVMEYRISDLIAISPELLYSRQGIQMKEEGATARIRLNYINLPVLAKIYVVDNFSFDIGPQIGLNIGSDIWAKAGGQTATIDLPSSEFDTPAPSTLEVGLALGVTYNIDRFFVQGRYNLGLTNIFGENLNSKNGVIQIGAGMKF